MVLCQRHCRLCKRNTRNKQKQQSQQKRKKTRKYQGGQRDDEYEMSTEPYSMEEQWQGQEQDKKNFDFFFLSDKSLDECQQELKVNQRLSLVAHKNPQLSMTGFLVELRQRSTDLFSNGQFNADKYIVRVKLDMERTPTFINDNSSLHQTKQEWFNKMEDNYYQIKYGNTVKYSNTDEAYTFDSFFDTTQLAHLNKFTSVPRQRVNSDGEKEKIYHRTNVFDKNPNMSINEFVTALTVWGLRSNLNVGQLADIWAQFNKDIIRHADSIFIDNKQLYTFPAYHFAMSHETPSQVVGKCLAEKGITDNDAYVAKLFMTQSIGNMLLFMILMPKGILPISVYDLKQNLNKKQQRFFNSSTKRFTFIWNGNVYLQSDGPLSGSDVGTIEIIFELDLIKNTYKLTIETNTTVENLFVVPAEPLMTRVKESVNKSLNSATFFAKYHKKEIGAGMLATGLALATLLGTGIIGGSGSESGLQTTYSMFTSNLKEAYGKLKPPLQEKEAEYEMDGITSFMLQGLDQMLLEQAGKLLLPLHLFVNEGHQLYGGNRYKSIVVKKKERTFTFRYAGVILEQTDPDKLTSLRGAIVVEMKVDWIVQTVKTTIDIQLYKKIEWSSPLMQSEDEASIDSNIIDMDDDENNSTTIGDNDSTDDGSTDDEITNKWHLNDSTINEEPKQEINEEPKEEINEQPNYVIVPTVSDGNCFFDAVSKSFDINHIKSKYFKQRMEKLQAETQVNYIPHTIADLRKYVADNITQDKFNNYDQRYRDIFGFLLKNIGSEHKKYEDFIKKSNGIETETIKDIKNRINELEKQYDSLLVQHRDIAFMKQVESVFEFREMLQTKHYWADEMAISMLQQELQMRFIILSPRSNTKIITPDGQLDSSAASVICANKMPINTSINRPILYVILYYTGNHYELIRYKGQGQFTFQTLPQDVKKLAAETCPGVYKELPGWDPLVQQQQQQSSVKGGTNTNTKTKTRKHYIHIDTNTMNKKRRTRSKDQRTK